MKKKKTYSLLPQHCTPQLEGNINIMDKYDAIETDQYGIYLDNLIRTICHLQDDDKQDVMATAKTEKQVYLFYQAAYQSNVDYLEAFKVNLKLNEAYNG